MRDWGLRANYNKIRYPPYISNPALAGFNMRVVELLPRGLFNNIFGKIPFL
jgi:hypothetical protein